MRITRLRVIPAKVFGIGRASVYRMLEADHGGGRGTGLRTFWQEQNGTGQIVLQIGSRRRAIACPT